MTNYEIEKGEIIRQNGIVNVLEQMGFKENEDFIFLRNGNTEPYLIVGGVNGEEPSEAIQLGSGKRSPIVIRSKNAGKDIEIPVIDDEKMSKFAVDKDGHYKYGVVSGNNGVSAVYIPLQGMVLSPSYEIRDIMIDWFGMKDEGFSVPMSNAESFYSKSLQQIWREMRERARSWYKKYTPDELEQKRKDKTKKYEEAMHRLNKKIDIAKMPLWAQEQLKKHDIQK